ncbi:MAG TPA: branched-chain amino acid ABC transporter ATP-binding protein [Syntrophomonas sp.]|jgi:branched-chain amino acid transport system ATP-binding protein|nr:branched-chain amino acid ABC transporter ATP-binding protein [Syntrophomonas sp.]HCF72088.1 branched-chain amino acid ABC transporter ATP-binding protein [Syntrophomonas sp.]
MLEINNLNVAYGDTQVIWDLNLKVEQGEIVTMLGPNGAGKTTILRTICGLVKPASGNINFQGEDLLKVAPHERPRHGIVMVPEGRRLFPKMTVEENLAIAAWKEDKKQETLDWIYETMPRLAERRKQLAGTLSGGEQQMCAIGRGIMAQPALLMLDEPSLGLAPIIVEQVFDILLKLKDKGITIFFVEQFVEQSLRISSRGYLCEGGRIVLKEDSASMLNNDYVRQVYMGIA